MTSAKLLRRQAAKCAGLATQSHDEESRQRFQRLEQTYLHLADEEEQQMSGVNATISGTESRHAT
jgi:thymidylate kinase